MPLRHRPSGVPLSLHSFGTLRAPPRRRMTKKNPSMDFFWYRRIASQFCVLLSRASMRSLFIGKKVHPRHPELDSGSVPRIYALSKDGQESTLPSPGACRRGLFTQKISFSGLTRRRLRTIVMCFTLFSFEYSSPLFYHTLHILKELLFYIFEFQYL